MLEKVTRLIATTRKAQWQFSDSDIEDFSRRVGSRAQVTCSHVGAALRKRKVPKWASQIVDINQKQQEEEPQQEGAGEEPQEVDEEEDEIQISAGIAEDLKFVDQWYIGWSVDLEQAWRVKSDKPQGAKQHTQEVIVPEGASDSNFVLARWADGFSARFLMPRPGSGELEEKLIRQRRTAERKRRRQHGLVSRSRRVPAQGSAANLWMGTQICHWHSADTKVDHTFLKKSRKP